MAIRQHDTTPREHRPEAFASEHARARLLAGLPVTERFLQLDGVRTAVLVGGDGMPLVLLHGPGEYAAKWLRVIPHLVRTHRVIVPDLPGHGASDPLDPPDADRVIAWLGALIAQTCAAPPVLVGQILGGAIAARFASVHGERIAGLVLSDALGLAPFQPTPEFAAALGRFLAVPTEATHDGLWRRCAFDLDALQAQLGERWAWITAENLRGARNPRLRATREALMTRFGFTAIAAEDLARITVPTRLIWGRHDLATPLAVAEATAAAQDWPLRVIASAGDDPPMEQPEAFVDALHEAVATMPGGDAAAWDALARAYDAIVTPSHLELSREGLRRAGLQAGMRFLDVAAGSGALSIPAARMGARVLAVDRSPAMLERLHARAEAEAVAVETRVMDGHALALADDDFDMAGSQFGVMLFPDMPRGLREMVRVVKPGGRVLVLALGDPARIEFLGFLVRALQSVRPGFKLPDNPPPLPLQLRDPERMRSELASAGLRAIELETVEEPMRFETGLALWRWLVSSNPVVESVLGGLHLTESERGVVRESLERLVRERAGAQLAAVITAPVNIGIGIK